MNDHRVPLAGGWSVWRWVRLRGAGFPASRVLGIADEACAPLIQQLLACDRVFASASAEEAAAAAEAVSSAERAIEDRVAAFEPVLSAKLREEAREPRFKEAVVWQNRTLLASALDPLAAKITPAANADERKRLRNREQLVASYLQRFAVKNDTIGFFGPTSFGTIERGGSFVLEPGASLVSRRTVAFEHWAIEAVAQMFAADPELRSFLAPRRMPKLRIDGLELCSSAGQRWPLPPKHARILQRCDGSRSADTIAGESVGSGVHDAQNKAQALAIIASLHKSRLITWTLEIPTQPGDPEPVLRRLLEQIPPHDARSKAIAFLDELKELRDAVARAAGEWSRLDRALADLELAFTKITSKAATRNAGRTYGARTIVYEDCRRDVRLELGASILERFGPALSLVLTSARWFTSEIAKRFDVRFREAHAALANPNASGAVELLQFLGSVSAILAEDRTESPIVEEVVRDLQAGWSRILSIDERERSIVRTSASIREEVETSFRAPGPGWPLARHQSPDLLIAASSVEAIARGELIAVLGELHTGCNLNFSPIALAQHPDPWAMHRARAIDVPDPFVEPVLSGSAVHRAVFQSSSPDDLQLELGEARAWRPRTHALEVGELVVEMREGRLEVRTRDGRRRFSAIAFLSRFLIAATLSQFEMFPVLRHAPRVSIDGLVVARERWRFDARELAFRNEKGRARPLVACARWADRFGIPRFVFVKTPENVKPFYVDLLSPILVEIFLREARRASVVTISEMLPSHGQCWLADANGERYTSELRLSAVDPLSWRAPDGSS